MYNLLNYILWDIPPNIQVGEYQIKLYSLFFSIGLLCGGIIVIKLLKSRSIPESYIIYAFVGMLLGARLFHCLFYDTFYFFYHPIEILSPFKLIDGGYRFVGYNGLASHGGIIGMMIALVIYAKRNKTDFLVLWDVLAIVTPLVGAFIRLGNLMNSEILGIPTKQAFAFMFARIDNITRHPVQLYEAIYYFLLFFLMILIYKKIGVEKYKSGFYTAVGLLGIAIFRFLIEFLKEKQEGFTIPLPINMGQILSIPFIVVGIMLLIKTTKKASDR